ncbi:MAG: PfkB family carbohydrate kinase, partial [Novosphingobium sp.]
IYDRVGSSFAATPPEAWPWDDFLEGASWLHLSGITAALGPGGAEAAIRAAQTARARGVKVSFDVNWRDQLWARWPGEPRRILVQLVSNANVLFGNHRDVSLLLGRDLSGDDPAARRRAAEDAFVAFPGLAFIASTIRQVETAESHRLTGRIDTPERCIEAEEIPLLGIVERIGGGDAFAAGILHGLLSGDDLERILQSGLALAALKHSLPGDACCLRQSDIDVFLGNRVDIRR